MPAQGPDLLKYYGPVAICYDVRALVRYVVRRKLAPLVCKGFAPWKAETLLQAYKQGTAEGEPRPRAHASYGLPQSKSAVGADKAGALL